MRLGFEELERCLRVRVTGKHSGFERFSQAASDAQSFSRLRRVSKKFDLLVLLADERLGLAELLAIASIDSPSHRGTQSRWLPVSDGSVMRR